MGIIYIDPKTDIVKVSKLTFWGRREDIFVRQEDIVPWSDSNQARIGGDIKIEEKLREHFFVLLQDIRQTVWSMKFYDNLHHDLFMCTRLGGIKDKKLFDRVFGEVI